MCCVCKIFLHSVIVCVCICKYVVCVLVSANCSQHTFFICQREIAAEIPTRLVFCDPRSAKSETSEMHKLMLEAVLGNFW
jgi:hypothetical protein